MDKVSEQCVITSINVARLLPVFVHFLYASCDSFCNRIHEVDRSVLCLLHGLSCFGKSRVEQTIVRDLRFFPFKSKL